MHDLYDSLTLPSVSKKKVIFWPIQTSDGSRVSQMPGSPEVLTYMLTTDKIDYFTPCTCARGNLSKHWFLNLICIFSVSKSWTVHVCTHAAPLQYQLHYRASLKLMAATATIWGIIPTG